MHSGTKSSAWLRYFVFPQTTSRIRQWWILREMFIGVESYLATDYFKFSFFNCLVMVVNYFQNFVIYATVIAIIQKLRTLGIQGDIRELKHVGRQHDDDGNQYNESMKRNK